MNNDSSSSTAADLPPTADITTRNDTTEAAESHPRTEDVKTPAQKKAHVQAKKKNEHLGRMMEQLDLLIYVELCILYYMDCSLFRLLLRVINQLMFLTPKPNFNPPTPKHRPYIGAIFAPNIICMLLHIFTARSEAGEAMRGYLHGGLIIDLIGQKGPTSKVHLVFLDILVLALQCFMLSVHVEQERITTLVKILASPATATTSASTESRGEATTTQDVDAEERGVLRDAVTNNGDNEMGEIQSAARTGIEGDATSERNEEHERLLSETAPRRRQEQDDTENPLDMFYTGNAVLADFHVIDTLRRQWDDYGRASESALQTVGFSAEFARVAANRRLAAAGQRLQLQVDSLG